MMRSRKIAWFLYTGAAVVEIAFVIGFLIGIIASKVFAAMGILFALAFGALGLIIDPSAEDEVKADKELTNWFVTTHCEDVRLAMGLIYTEEEFEEDKRRILNRPLP